MFLISSQQLFMFVDKLYHNPTHNMSSDCQLNVSANHCMHECGHYELFSSNCSACMCCVVVNVRLVYTDIV